MNNSSNKVQSRPQRQAQPQSAVQPVEKRPQREKRPQQAHSNKPQQQNSNTGKVQAGQSPEYPKGFIKRENVNKESDKEPDKK